MFENYRQASLRGVPFECNSRGSRGGRRVDVGEIPFGETYTTRDMGKRPRRFQFDAFIFGADWLTRAARFEEALEQGGVARLVHPTRGELDVLIEEWSEREDESKALDERTYRIDCVAAKDVTLPAAEIDHRTVVSEAAAAVPAPVTSTFVEEWVPPGGEQVSVVSDAVETDAVASIDALSGELRDLVQVPNPLAGAADALVAINELSATATALIRTPADLASSFISVISGIRSAVLAPFQALLRLARFGIGLSSLDLSFPFGQSDGVVGGNRAALGQLVAANALAQAADAALDQEFTTFDDALAARRDLAETIDVVERTALASRQREVAITLQHLRTVSWSGLGDVAVSLPRLTDATPGGRLSARALSWRIRGDIDVAADIVARNRVDHPAMLPPNRDLKVITGASNG